VEKKGMTGAWWAVSAAVIFSLGHVAIRRGVGILGVQLGTAVMLVAATLTISLAALLIEDVQILAAATWTGIFYFVMAGLVHFIGGWSFMNASTQLIGASRMSAITGVTPLFAALLAIASLNESVNLYIGLGILLIVFGVFLISRS
jgi:drug/metabolite transporter (DMT)-like permease